MLSRYSTELFVNMNAGDYEHDFYSQMYLWKS